MLEGLVQVYTQRHIHFSHQLWSSESIFKWSRLCKYRFYYLEILHFAVEIRFRLKYTVHYNISKYI